MMSSHEKKNYFFFHSIDNSQKIFREIFFSRVGHKNFPLSINARETFHHQNFFL